MMMVIIMLMTMLMMVMKMGLMNHHRFHLLQLLWTERLWHDASGEHLIAAGEVQEFHVFTLEWCRIALMHHLNTVVQVYLQSEQVLQSGYHWTFKDDEQRSSFLCSCLQKSAWYSSIGHQQCHFLCGNLHLWPSATVSSGSQSHKSFPSFLMNSTSLVISLFIVIYSSTLWQHRSSELQ